MGVGTSHRAYSKRSTLHYLVVQLQPHLDAEHEPELGAQHDAAARDAHRDAAVLAEPPRDAAHEARVAEAAARAYKHPNVVQSVAPLKRQFRSAGD